mgnify:FL=1
MTDTQKKPLWKNELVWLFLLTSGLFAILYSKFILGGYAYVFTDTGADTMQINYAQYGLFLLCFGVEKVVMCCKRDWEWMCRPIIRHI